MLTDATTNGAAVTAPVFDGIIQSLPPLKISAYTKERFIQECSMSLFANVHFDSNPNIVKAAQEAVKRAQILANQLSFEE